MDENDSSNLDLEYKRYLRILRPYIKPLADDDIIAVCNAWIQRLSTCKENEKSLRNKYVFSLCYQIAKGSLEDPFLKYPSESCLSPLSESLDSDGSESTEVECHVVDPVDSNTEELFRNEKTPISEIEYLSQFNHNEFKEDNHDTFNLKSSKESNTRINKETEGMCYMCPEILREFTNGGVTDGYEIRANNLIRKLRDIKIQNMTLHNELMTLKEESDSKHNNSFADDMSSRIDRATSSMLQNNESSITLKSLKYQLQEAHESRNALVEKISSLQEQLHNLNELKMHEIQNIEVNHKIEIINIKSAAREEVKTIYEKKLEDLKEEYELKINTLRNKSSQDIDNLSITKDDLIEEKNKMLTAKDKEISQLNNQIEDLKKHLHAVVEKFIEKPISSNGDDSLKFKAEQLEKHLSRVEKNKMKFIRTYESKISQLQREKQLTEYSLKLQMVRQRAQVVNEVTDENQCELTSALDKLETKYKEIVASVQATAIQRRMQDQMALESILHAACGTPNENKNSQGNKDHFPKTMHKQNRPPHEENLPLCRGNKVGNIRMGNKSLGEDSFGYCLNRERMGELFERVYIPQRDNPDAMK